MTTSYPQSAIDGLYTTDYPTTIDEVVERYKQEFDACFGTAINIGTNTGETFQTRLFGDLPVIKSPEDDENHYNVIFSLAKGDSRIPHEDYTGDLVMDARIEVFFIRDISADNRKNLAPLRDAQITLFWAKYLYIPGLRKLPVPLVGGLERVQFNDPENFNPENIELVAYRAWWDIEWAFVPPAELCAAVGIVDIFDDDFVGPPNFRVSAGITSPLTYPEREISSLSEFMSAPIPANANDNANRVTLVIPLDAMPFDISSLSVHVFDRREHDANDPTIATDVYVQVNTANPGDTFVYSLARMRWERTTAALQSNPTDYDIEKWFNDA